ncbi:Inosine/uridine-preferring nucleoside hydrolase domain-containing protein [Radiomyces spectabilis]|uniref:Inosine/uridine-preferring nucleoside hydrolase domain-containing protein n=1 Tax=Radiomyces spectabilis TaxID=64574 RepID=UPI00221F3670|nr:Inosine/uridine-preferring nucleoside hydrolase domain-containing protein [Radiomyces spectabilis]KAI8372843.1 Inosine/uridine-preferring nucleoside hydrolase domain-containing protein [Radiomyces spectabilis]
MVAQREPIIIDTDPGIDDALAIFMALLSPEVEVRAITLTHGNTSLEHVKRNAVTLMHVFAEHQKHLGIEVPIDSLPVLAAGCDRPLKADLISATYFHGEDGMGEVYSKNLHKAPSDWENQLLHKAEEKVDNEYKDGERPAFKTTPRDAADEILHQLREAPPLTISILAVGPLTNIALAYQRDPVAFGRAKRIVIMGGAVDGPGNVTPMAEFNFRADADAADIVMSSTQGFQHTPEGYQQRLDLISQNKPAPAHVVVVPLDASDEGAVTKQDYEKYIIPVDKKTPVATFCNAFLIWTFETCFRLYNLESLAIYDAFTLLTLIDMTADKGDGKNTETLDKHWSYKHLDMHVETSGIYTTGMCVYDRRLWDETSFDNGVNNVQVITKGDGRRFNQYILNRVFDANIQL